MSEFPLFQLGVVDGGRDAEDGVRSVHGLLEGFLVVRVRLDDFDTLLLQCLGGGLGEIAGDAADFELLGQFGVVDDIVDDGAALLAGGAEDGEELGHCRDGGGWGVRDDAVVDGNEGYWA